MAKQLKYKDEAARAIKPAWTARQCRKSDDGAQGRYVCSIRNSARTTITMTV